MIDDPRPRLAPWLVLALAAAALLTAGLPSLELRPGLPLPAIEAGGIAVVADERGGAAAAPVGALVWALVAALCAGLLLHAAWQLLRGVRAGAIAAALARALALVLAAGGALVLLALLPYAPGVAPDAPLPPPPAAAPRTALGAPPGWLALLVAAAIPLCAGLGVALLLVPARRPRGALRLVERAAARARDALRAGGDARDAVIRCYARMMEVVEAERGVTRDGTATAREFERVLASLGLPGEALRGLTAAFEVARYGAGAPTAAEVEAALGCLERIAAHCAAARGVP